MRHGKGKENEQKHQETLIIDDKVMKSEVTLGF